MQCVGLILGQCRQRVGPILGQYMQYVGPILGQCMQCVGPILGQCMERVGPILGQCKQCVGPICTPLHFIHNFLLIWQQREWAIKLWFLLIVFSISYSIYSYFIRDCPLQMQFFLKCTFYHYLYLGQCYLFLTKHDFRVNGCWWLRVWNEMCFIYRDTVRSVVGCSAHRVLWSVLLTVYCGL
jgi:hypothetical protein